MLELLLKRYYFSIFAASQKSSKHRETEFFSLLCIGKIVEGQKDEARLEFSSVESKGTKNRSQLFIFLSNLQFFHTVVAKLNAVTIEIKHFQD